MASPRRRPSPSTGGTAKPFNFAAAGARDINRHFFDLIRDNHIAAVKGVLTHFPEAALWHEAVNADERPFSRNLTPLMAAAEYGHTDIALLLLQAEAEVNAQDSRGYSALHYAAWQDRRETAELLLWHGADIALTTETGNSPSMLARIRANMKMAHTIEQHAQKKQVYHKGLPFAVAEMPKIQLKRPKPDTPPKTP